MCSCELRLLTGGNSIDNIAGGEGIAVMGGDGISELKLNMSVVYGFPSRGKHWCNGVVFIVISQQSVIQTTKRGIVNADCGNR